MSTARLGASIVDKAFSALEAVLVFVLGAMVVMVFANVVLRYGFGSGITVSEEISRFLFVWRGAPGSRRSSTWRTLRPSRVYPWAGRISPASSAQLGSAS